MSDPRPLRHVPSEACSDDTAQSAGMRRTAGISAATAQASRVFMGQTEMAPGAVSAAHHHGELETAIYVLEGQPSFVFLEHGEEVRIHAKPGDYVLVPPFTPHVEENLGDEPAVVLLARSGQESIVENLASLHG